jgi:Tfp pilus assembly protein PilF
MRRERRGARRGHAFVTRLATVLLLGFALRCAYVMHQRTIDPTFARPVMDGAYYLDWARGLTGMGAAPGGAFYLAPLFAYTLAGFRAIVGENFFALYLLQHLLSIATAGLLALIARRSAGDVAGLGTAVLAMLYHPAIFFASAPLSETIAILFLAAALWFAGKTERAERTRLIAGLFAGASALARPNLLLVPVVWAGERLAARRFREAALVFAGVAAIVLPVTLRNLAASGHPVLISSNGGLALYHGNGPGASGIHVRIPGTSGTPQTQREETTALASKISGRTLDAVEADRWWGQRALEVRLADPGGTAKLLAYRALLLLDSREHALDYAPSLDENAWRPTLRWPRDSEIPIVAFGILLGLAAAALIRSGIRGSGGAQAWLAIAASALTPLVFSMSSRYRLPTTLLLAIPAGAGFAAIIARATPARARSVAVAVAAACALVSFVIPSSALIRIERASTLANRAQARLAIKQIAAAERDARDATRIAPEQPTPWFALGIIMQESGRMTDAEEAYRNAHTRDPNIGAANLAAVLLNQRRPAEAIPILREALEHNPAERALWTNLVVALAMTGDPAGAREATERASQHGIAIDPRLLEALRKQGGGP